MGGPVLDASGPPRVTAPSQRARLVIVGLLAVALALVGIFVALSNRHASVPGTVASFNDTGSQPVSGLAFSPSGNMLAVADANGNADLWDARTQSVGVLNDPDDQEAGAVAFSPSGSTLAIGAANNTHLVGFTDLVSLPSTKLIARLSAPSFLPQAVVGVAFSPNGRMVAAADTGGLMFLWSTGSHKLLAALADPNGGSNYSVAFSPDGGVVATGDDSGSISVYSTSTHRVVATMNDPNSIDIVQALAYSPDGGTLAAFDSSGVIYLWNTSTHKIITSLYDPHGRGVNCLAYSRTGSMLATGDLNGLTYVWNTSTDKVIATFGVKHGSRVKAVAFGPGGVLAVGHANGEVDIWKVKH